MLRRSVATFQKRFAVALNSAHSLNLSATAARLSVLLSAVFTLILFVLSSKDAVKQAKQEEMSMRDTELCAYLL